ncbi:MAG TPA: hypothetical protein VHP36_08230 [Chitinispirillaceae bacterium]|nr:hypothetical protein [Chitinispirillaceae bacterium]
MIPPLFLGIAIGKSDERTFRLWFPLVVLWPFLIAILILLIPLAAVAQVILSTKNIRPLSILIGLFYLIVAFRGLTVDVQNNSSKRGSVVKIKFS